VIVGRSNLGLPKYFWLTESDEKSCEVQIVIEDGRRFTRRFVKRFQNNRPRMPYVYSLKLGQAVLDALGVTLGDDECLIQLVEPTLIKIKKVENGSAGGSGRKAPVKAIPAKRSAQEEEVCTQRPAPSGRGRGRGRAGKPYAAPASRSSSLSAPEPIEVVIGTELLIVRQVIFSTFYTLKYS